MDNRRKDNPYHYSMQWPQDGLDFTCYAHEIMNFRYNWHEQEYELNIVLKGSAEYCRGSSMYVLHEDDLILIDPAVGHASFALDQNTVALVLRFPAGVFRNYVQPEQLYSFPACVCCDKDRYAPRYNRIRYCAAGLMLAAEQGGPYADLAAKSALEMLLATLCRECAPEPVSTLSKEDSLHRETIRRITEYVEANYASKITLEELSRISQYNRTYISTFFKNTMGMNFYEYLTRIRFQHALFELVTTRKPFTQVAIDNGFPDLKSFNNRFTETFGRRPAEYRSQVSPEQTVKRINQMNYLDPSLPPVRGKLQAYTLLAADRPE